MHSFSDPSPLQRMNLSEWITAHDLGTVFDLNKSYIRGELDTHPAHPYPIQMETQGLKKSLLTMNDYGLFTFQGQPQTDGSLIAPPRSENPTRDDDVENSETPSEPSTDDPKCRICALPPQKSPDQWTEVRQLPYVQFCVPIAALAGTATIDAVTNFAMELIADKRLHTQISWPKNLEIPASIPWASARTGRSFYISSADLESEVNDYHLLRPRMPDWFYKLENSQNVVFGVNAIDWDDRLQLEEEILTTAKISCMPKCFVDDPRILFKSPCRAFASMPKT